MRYLIYSLLAVSVFTGCRKNHNGSRIDIYLLNSYTVSTNPPNPGMGPASTVISNAVLAPTPFVADKDIKYYTRSTSVFKLNKNIKPTIQNYGPDKAFAVTVDGDPVYFGKFHPAYLSSMIFGLATIDPLLLVSDSELPIRFINITGMLEDIRSDSRIIDALRATGRLR